MKMFYMLDCYIGRMIAGVTFLALSILISLSGIIKFVDQMKQTGKGNYDAFGAGIYTVLNIPKDLQLFSQISALLGVLLGLWILANRNELVIMQAAGFSHVQIALSVMKMAMPLVLLLVAIDEWIAPRCEWMAQKYRKKAMFKVTFPFPHKGIWVKDGNEFTYIEHVKSKNELNGIFIYIFNNYCKIESIRYAATAKFDVDNGLWNLSQVITSDLTESIRISESESEKASSTWKTNLTPDKLNIIITNPDILSARDLYYYVKYLKATGQEFKRYQLNMWKKIFHPFSVPVIMLIGLSFIFCPLPRIVPVRNRVIIGVSSGFIFYILYQILGPLALVHEIPPAVGALLPNIVFFSVSLWLLLKKS